MPLQDISAPPNALRVAVTPGGTKRKREDEPRVVEVVVRDAEIEPAERLGGQSGSAPAAERGVVGGV